jgi:hypothetical protein
MVAVEKKRWKNFFCPATLLEKTARGGAVEGGGMKDLEGASREPAHNHPAS